MALPDCEVAEGVAINDRLAGPVKTGIQFRSVSSMSADHLRPRICGPERLTSIVEHEMPLAASAYSYSDIVIAEGQHLVQDIGIARLRLRAGYGPCTADITGENDGHRTECDRHVAQKRARRTSAVVVI